MEAKELQRKQRLRGTVHRWVGVGAFSWAIERMTYWLYRQVKSNGVVQLAMVILLDLLFLDPNCSRNIQAFVYFSKDSFCHPATQFLCADENLGTICAWCSVCHGQCAGPVCSGLSHCHISLEMDRPGTSILRNFSSAQSTTVFYCLWHSVWKQPEGAPTQGLPMS